MNNLYQTWQPLLEVWSKDDASAQPALRLTSHERGVVYALLSSPPQTLSEAQLTTLRAIRDRWEQPQQGQLS